MVYRLFYHDGDYPVLKFLKQPLYFEVGMDHSRDSKVAVGLENCWATLTKDRESQPKWDLIVDGYVWSIVCVCWTFLFDEGSNSSSLIRCPNPKGPEQTIIHPVSEDDRVDIPDHFKRFEVKELTLREDDGSSESEDATMARRVSWKVFRICIKNTNGFQVLHCSFYISSKCVLNW